MPTRLVVGKEAPVGVEPTMTDLQSVALATWPRRHESLPADHRRRLPEKSLYPCRPELPWNLLKS
jgi:hypothetical protein